MTVTEASRSADLLIAELQARGLHYLIGPLLALPAPRLTDEELLAALAQQHDARVRSSLIPLFLQQPHLTKALPLALQWLAPREQMVLKIYYTAAVILQEQYEPFLRQSLPRWHPLPDLYGAELGISQEESGEERLRQLGAFHAQLTGLRINWSGTYQQAATTWIRHLKRIEQRAA